MRPFVAIDFETANEQRCSACSVGLVKYDEAGQIIDRFHSLIRPHPEADYFSPVNTWIHGLTEDDVADAPQWSEILDEIRAFIGDLPIVAHYMPFDAGVLRGLAEIYDHEPLPNRKLCTYRLARAILPTDKPKRKKLDNVYRFYFPGESFEHHQATADAEACGRIFARMCQDYTFEQLEELCPISHRDRPGSLVGSRAEQVQTEELIRLYGANPTALDNECVVFTGTLKHAQRKAAQALVEACGGTPDERLTKRTTILVVGIPDPRLWAEGASASKKLQKATRFKEAGSPIEVMSEEDFFQRLTEHD